MTRPTATAALRAAARHAWDWVRGRHRCRTPEPCDWILGRHDGPTCPDHTELPDSTQRFMRHPKPTPSTEENP